jgi:hypothetical protein
VVIDASSGVLDSVQPVVPCRRPARSRQRWRVGQRLDVAGQAATHRRARQRAQRKRRTEVTEARKAAYWCDVSGVSGVSTLHGARLPRHPCASTLGLVDALELASIAPPRHPSQVVTEPCSTSIEAPYLG